jgi:hippurate hydrolase
MNQGLLMVSALVLAAPLAAQDGAKALAPRLNAIYPELKDLYIDLHKNPELAFQEKRTAGVLAEGLKKLGFEVTTGVGGTGVVGLLKNGAGPVVMLRTELDGLPMEEKTGLPFASKATGIGSDGAPVPTAHACGHDLHMSAWFGTARLMAQSKGDWHGTLMLVGQPAEETVSGAAAMLKDGLFTRFPKPDFAISMHDDPSLPSGVIGYFPGYFRASSDSLDITIFGRGGHGARPQTTVDPVLIAARSILALQTLVSRENNPMDPAVVTVGAMHAGTVANIIPDQATLRISVRAFSPRVRKRLLAGIERQVKAEAMAASAPGEPSIKTTSATDSVFNDPALTKRMVDSLQRGLGPGAVVEMSAQMTSEDFSQYGLAGVPAVLLHIGAVDPATLKAAEANGTVLPGPHSPQWAPSLEPTLKALVTAETLMLMDLMGRH